MFNWLSEHMPALPFVLVVGAFLLSVSCVGMALLRTKGVGATFGWIFAILAFPLVGSLIYLAFSNPRVGRTLRLRARSAEAMERKRGAVEKSGLPRDLDSSELAIDLLEIGSVTGGCQPTLGNRIELFSDGKAAFAAIEAALQTAEHTIWAEFYIIQNDVTGRKFLDILLQRARAGVEVRLIYDALGSAKASSSVIQEIRAAGGYVKPFLPLNPLARRWSVHLRNHRKLLICDGQVALTGGMNVGDEYSGVSRARKEVFFRDVHCQVEGPVVGSFIKLFAQDWYIATSDVLSIGESPGAVEEPGALLLALPSGPDQEPNATATTLFGALAGARHRILLTSPYFIPDEAIQSALIAAALRGVDVRVIVPAKSDVRVVRLASLSYYARLLAGGVRIFEYQPSMLHSKTMVVDQEIGIFGSANLDIRSFRLNFELSMIAINEEFANKLASRFEEDASQCLEVTEAAVEQWGMLRRLKQGMARLMSPVL